MLCVGVGALAVLASVYLLTDNGAFRFEIFSAYRAGRDDPAYGLPIPWPWGRLRLDRPGNSYIIEVI